VEAESVDNNKFQQTVFSTAGIALIITWVLNLVGITWAWHVTLFSSLDRSTTVPVHYVTIVWLGVVLVWAAKMRCKHFTVTAIAIAVAMTAVPFFIGAMTTAGA
jgi:FtsH-binding integral membrane protein